MFIYISSYFRLTQTLIRTNYTDEETEAHSIYGSDVSDCEPQS